MFCFSSVQLHFHSLSLSFFLAGVGRTAPDPSASVTLDGVQVPLGKGCHTNIDDTSLLYNEYPLTLTVWFMSLIIILPTFSLHCHIIDYLIVCRKVPKSQRLSQYMLFLTLNKLTLLPSSHNMTFSLKLDQCCLILISKLD